MTKKISGPSFAMTLGVALIGLGLTGLPANANNQDKGWNRGCADAKAGSYDRAKHGEAYEKGWQACKAQAPGPSKEDDDYSRGCSDAKAGSYDRAHPTPAYERGWQSCNEKDEANDEAKAGKERQAQWDRGCADSKANSYDRASHNADYEAGWQACKSN
jgi:hypothetical protein